MKKLNKTLSIALLGVLAVCFLSAGCASAQTYGTFGHTTAETPTAVGDYLLGHIFELNLEADITAINVYCKSDAGSQIVQTAIYSSDLTTCYYNDTVGVIVTSGSGEWATRTGLNVHLQAGNYWLFATAKANLDIGFASTAGGGYKAVTYPYTFPETLTLDSTTWNNQPSIYCNYTVYVPATPTPTPYPTVIVNNTNYTGIAVLALFTLIALYFSVKPFGSVNFVAGIITIAVSIGLAAGGFLSNLWFFTFAGVVFGVICMLRATDLL